MKFIIKFKACDSIFTNFSFIIKNILTFLITLTLNLKAKSSKGQKSKNFKPQKLQFSKNFEPVNLQKSHFVFRFPLVGTSSHEVFPNSKSQTRIPFPAFHTVFLSRKVP